MRRESDLFQMDESENRFGFRGPTALSMTRPEKTAEKLMSLGFQDPTMSNYAHARYLQCLQSATSERQLNLCITFYNIGAFNS